MQGPPGTGKTTRMAQLAASLLKENKSVLVTALTNQMMGGPQGQNQQGMRPGGGRH